MPLVVDSSVERLRVQGFRFDNTSDDTDAWDIWQANNLDGESNLVHTEAVKLGMAYWLVEPPGDRDYPRITAEHPSQVIVATDPGDRRKRLAAFKKWQDGDAVYGTVYLPDRIIKYQTTSRQFLLEVGPKQWTTVSAASNPLGRVPVIPVPNNPSMLKEGRSDLAGGPIEIQNAINLLLSTTLIGAEYLAYPLRVLLGVDVPKDPVTGLPIPDAELRISQSRLLMFPGNAADMDLKEFSPADLSNLRGAIDGLIRDLTAQTRTPPHYVAGQIVNASGDALKAAETGLVSKVKDKQDPFGEAHEEMIRLAFRSVDADDPRATATSAETNWVDPESRSDAERVDAAVKLQGIGVPQEALWERIGASPQEIERWKVMAETEQLEAEANALLNPPPVAPVNGQPPEPMMPTGVPLPPAAPANAG